MLWASQTRAAAAQMETKASESVKFSDLSDAQDLCLTLSKPFNGEDITISCSYQNALLSIYPVTVAWAFLHLSINFTPKVEYPQLFGELLFCS